MKKNILSIIMLIMGCSQLFAQLPIELKESIKKVKPNIYALVLDIKVPEGMVMGALPYGLVTTEQFDTFLLTIQLDKIRDYELLGRLKASYAPNVGHLSSCYSKEVSFVQLIKINEDVDKDEIILSGALKYRTANLQSSAHIHHMRVDKAFFRFRLVQESGRPKISVGHQCMTQEVLLE